MMMITRFDRKYHFYSRFDPVTGRYLRSGILNEDGTDSGREPFMASFPHLLDVGIMGECVHGISGLCLKSGVQCYQDGLNRRQSNMSLVDFQRLAGECAGKVYQFALGGRGDPEMHAHFESILAVCQENRIVPNLTTSGLGLTTYKVQLIKHYCGAAAVSWYRSEHTMNALRLLIEAGVKTNIHYVLSQNSIDEALELIEHRRIPEGVGRIVFLLHKPVGLGTRNNVLNIMDPRVRRFFSLFNDEANCQLASFDSCCVPGLLNMAVRVHPASLEPCEGGRFSAYVTPDMMLLPCSFDQSLRWAVDLHEKTIEQAWYSDKFENYRAKVLAQCSGCELKELCLGGCPITPEIVLCGLKQGGIKIENQA